MIYATLHLSIDYSTLAVFDPAPETAAYLRPRPQHMAQGFRWRAGHVDFSTLEDVGPARVVVRGAAAVRVRPDTVRAILVPFTVPPTGTIIVGTIFEGDDSGPVKVPPGEYALLYETAWDDTLETGADTIRGMWCDLTFIPARSVEPAILRADAALSPTYPLLMEAEQA